MVVHSILRRGAPNGLTLREIPEVNVHGLAHPALQLKNLARHILNCLQIICRSRSLMPKKNAPRYRSVTGASLESYLGASAKKIRK
jgi:hypothetical protein